MWNSVLTIIVLFTFQAWSLQLDDQYLYNNPSSFFYIGNAFFFPQCKLFNKGTLRLFWTLSSFKQKPNNTQSSHIQHKIPISTWVKLKYFWRFTMSKGQHGSSKGILIFWLYLQKTYLRMNIWSRKSSLE